MRDSLTSENPCEDDEPTGSPTIGMSVAEKIALWGTYNEPDVPTFDTVEPDPITHDSVELDLPWRYAEVRLFILESPAYKWLINNIRSTAVLGSRGETVLDAISRNINGQLVNLRSPKCRFSNSVNVDMLMDWDLPTFLEAQQYGTPLHVAVEEAITITGAGTDAQALRCIDYMNQTWPSSGRETVSMLKQALMSPTLRCSCKLATSRLLLRLIFDWNRSVF